MNSNNYFNAFILVFLSGLCWSFGVVTVRYMVDAQLYVFQYLFYRGISIAIILLLYLFIKEGFNFYKNFFRIGLSGILGGIFLGIHFQFFFESIKLTTIANATFLGTLAPLFTLCLEKFWLKRNIQKNMIFALVIIFTGSLIIVSDQFDTSSNYTRGNLYALICSLWIALALMISENVRKDTETVPFSITLFSSAAITLMMISFYTGESLIGYTQQDYLGLLLLGLIPTVFGHSVFYFALRYVQPTIVASFPLGEPIIASIAAYFLFSETVGVSIILGGVLTIIGLFILVRLKRV